MCLTVAKQKLGQRWKLDALKGPKVVEFPVEEFHVSSWKELEGNRRRSSEDKCPL